MWQLKKCTRLDFLYEVPCSLLFFGLKGRLYNFIFILFNFIFILFFILFYLRLSVTSKGFAIVYLLVMPLVNQDIIFLLPQSVKSHGIYSSAYWLKTFSATDYPWRKASLHVPVEQLFDE